MLHEEVIVDWNSLQRQVQDAKVLEMLQMDFIVGVNNNLFQQGNAIRCYDVVI